MEGEIFAILRRLVLTSAIVGAEFVAVNVGALDEFPIRSRIAAGVEPGIALEPLFIGEDNPTSNLPPITRFVPKADVPNPTVGCDGEKIPAAGVKGVVAAPGGATNSEGKLVGCGYE